MIIAQCLALSFLIVRYAFVTMFVTVTCTAYRKPSTKFSKVKIFMHLMVYWDKVRLWIRCFNVGFRCIWNTNISIVGWSKL